MAEQVPTETPTVPPVEDKFGPPHPQGVSDSLQLWILIPGLIGLVLIGELNNIFYVQPLISPYHLMLYK